MGIFKRAVVRAFATDGATKWHRRLWVRVAHFVWCMFIFKSFYKMMLPIENVRRKNKRWGVHFRGTFQWFVAQIKCSHLSTVKSLKCTRFRSSFLRRHVFFKNDLNEMCLSTQDLSTHAYAVSRPRNPRLKDAHTGTKRRLDVKTNNRDSGIL